MRSKTMVSINPKSTARIGGHPIHPMLVPFPIAFFVATLLADIVFWRTGNSGWAVAAMWLLGAGLVGAALAALAGWIDFLSDTRIRALAHAWLHAIGNVTAVVISLISFYFRYMNGAEAGAQPTGIWLSLVVVVLLLVTGWLGGELVFRHRVGVADSP
jgi:uncharacterized membrane protein